MSMKVSFNPRRLGHVNLWVTDLEKSIAFYESICGIQLVRRERDLHIAFHSNGNTHHDVGMVETSRGKDRYGRDGTLQIPKTRGVAAGLNHLGWEMENERELVEAYRRALDAGYPMHRAVDHLISHSVYVSDPDGNGHEFYADEMRDWRRIYNLDVEDEVTGLWDPLAVPPKAEANYNVDPPILRVESAPVHPSHLTGARFATRQFDAMLDFFVSIAGLSIRDQDSAPRRRATLAGSTGRADITLVEAGTDEPTGLRSFRFVLAEAADVKALADKLRAANVDARVRPSAVPELVLHDPDAFEVEFYPPVTEPAETRS
jgi:catechol 2,3-dioxygenase